MFFEKSILNGLGKGNVTNMKNYEKVYILIAIALNSCF